MAFPLPAFFIFLSFVLLLLHAFVRRQLLRGRNKKLRSLAGDHPVSVVICARNEEANLRKNLPFLLDQAHRNSEWILVDDASEDATLEVMKEWAQKDKRIHVIAMGSKNHPGKKEALSKGVAAARHELILLTDADCRPASRQWISRMAAGLAQEHELILGYGPLQRSKGFRSKLMRFDAAVVAMHYLSLAQSGRPYMGVGRNMACRKSLYECYRPQPAARRIASGDDDLFVNAVAQKARIEVCLDPLSYMYSPHAPGLRMWWHQKRRHLSAGKYYQPGDLLLLAVYPFALLFFYLSFAALLISGSAFIALIVWLFYAFFALIITSRTFGILDQRDLRFAMPLLEFLYLVQQIVINLSLILKRPVRWK